MSSTKIIAAGMGGALAIAAGATGAALASTPATVQTPAVSQTASIQVAGHNVMDTLVRASTVEGVFSFSQTEVATNAYIAKNLGDANRVLCGANPSADVSDEAAEAWVLTVDGAVQNGFSITAGELADTEAVQAILMNCSCAGNPADGLATANALVEGISALVIVQMACPTADANTVVFTSADGYQVALPLSYLTSHYCPIVFNVNGAQIAASMGGTNQLWLGSTPASYFVRDVSSITLEARDEADIPASPTSDESRAEWASNLPNVGVLLGGEVQ